MVWRIGSGWSTYVSYGKGFSLPNVGIPLRNINTPGQTVAGILDLQALIVDNKEIGANWRGAKGSFGISAYKSYSDFGVSLSIDPLTGDFMMRRQPVEIKGVELTGEYNLDRDWRLNALYSRVRGKTVAVDGGPLVIEQGMANINPDKIGASVTWNYGAQASVRVGATTLLGRELNVGRSQFEKTAGYTLVDMNATLQPGPLRRPDPGRGKPVQPLLYSDLVASAGLPELRGGPRPGGVLEPQYQVLNRRQRSMPKVTRCAVNCLSRAPARIVRQGPGRRGRCDLDRSRGRRRRRAQGGSARKYVAAFLRSPEVLASNKLIIVRVNAIGSAHIAADIAAVAQAGLGMLNLPKVESAFDIAACAAHAGQRRGGQRHRAADSPSWPTSKRPPACARPPPSAPPIPAWPACNWGWPTCSRKAASPASTRPMCMQPCSSCAWPPPKRACSPTTAPIRPSPTAPATSKKRACRENWASGARVVFTPARWRWPTALSAPIADELLQARRIVAAAAVARQAGQAAFTVDGKMIDPPFVRRAAAVVAAAAGAELNPTRGPPTATAARRCRSAGVRVLDLSAYIAGPYGCTMLADMGAEVIKVEPPDGDNLRNYPSTLASASRAFLGVNRSKRGIAIDLKQPDGLDVLLRMVDQADVLVHNFRPGVAERLDIGYDQLKTRRPSLIYCAVTGYGEDGPMKDQAGYDQVLQTFTGICTLQGSGRAGNRLRLGGRLLRRLDGRLGRLGGPVRPRRQWQRQRAGQVCRRLAAAQRAGHAIGAPDLGRCRTAGHRPRHALGRHHRPASDQGRPHLFVGQHRRISGTTLCEKIGLPELAQEPKYATVKLRAQHAGELIPRLRAALATRSALEWEAAFGSEVPCAAARSIEAMFTHPQVLAENMIATMHHPDVGNYQGFAEAVRFGDAAPPFPFAAPAFGQHRPNCWPGTATRRKKSPACARSA